MAIRLRVVAVLGSVVVAALTLTAPYSQAANLTIRVRPESVPVTVPPKSKAVYLTSIASRSAGVPGLGGGVQLRADGRALIAAIIDRHHNAQLFQVRLHSQHRTQLSAPNGGGTANGSVSWATYAAGGHQVLYVSSATNLTSDRVNGEGQLYLRAHGRNTLLSTADAETPSAAVTDVLASANKRYVVWTQQLDTSEPTPGFVLRTWFYDSATGHVREVVSRTAGGALIEGCSVSAITRNGGRLLMTCGTRWEVINTGTGTAVTSLRVRAKLSEVDLSPSGNLLAYYAQRSGRPWVAYVLDLRTGRTRAVPSCGDYLAIAPAWNWMACAGMVGRYDQDFVASIATRARLWLGTRTGQLAKSVFFSSFTDDSTHAVILVPNHALGGPPHRWNVYLQPLP